MRNLVFSVNLAYGDLTRAHEGFETEEIMCHWLGLCVSWTYLGGWGESVGPLKLHVPFWGDACTVLLGGSNEKKWYDHQKKKIFKKSIEGLRPFKE